MTRLLPTMIAAAVLLAACHSDSDSGDTADDGEAVQADNLSELVVQQCNRQPENEEPIAVNGREFGPGTDFSSCL